MTKSPKNYLSRKLLSVIVLAGACVPLPGIGRALAEPPASPNAAVTVASADLRAEAVKAIRAGEFDKGTAILAKLAANGSSDTQLTKLSHWAAEYEDQRQGFVAERRKQFDKALGDVQKLVDAKADELAARFATGAYVLAEDKQHFADSDLIRGLVSRSAVLAADHETKDEWVQALRLYTSLTVLEPSEPKWKDKLKNATRHLRLTAVYTPDRFKALRDDETKELALLDSIIPPTTTRPATRPVASEEESAYKSDWHDNLKGIRADVLWQALIEVRSNYWRDVEFTKLMSGGINAIKIVANTSGLETAFPGLGDPAKKADFLAKVAELETTLQNAGKGTEVWESSRVYKKLLEANRQTIALPEEVFVYEFADGALAECDPFSNMIWPTEAEEFNKQTQGEFIGVGIQISSDDDGSLRVVSPIEDSPAFKAGIRANDIISHVNGKACKGITTTQAVRVITGPPGTSVTLTIKSPDGSSKDYTLVRETIKNGSLKGFTRKIGGGWDYMIDPDNRIAYLHLTGFTKTSGEELEKATQELKDLGARGVILDLRYNPGGLLTAAIDVANRFLDHGVIVSTHPDRPTPQPPTSASARPDPDEIKLPLVVLVNQYSASAAEIVSGALKDQGRAVIVGERSYGKGSVQIVFPLSKTSAIKLTTSHYYLPSGRCLHREENSTTWGVDPDVKVEMTPEQMNTAIRARTELDVLHAAGETPTTTESPTTQPADAATLVIKTPAALIKNDNQLGAALLLLRLQLNGAEVAVGTPAAGVNTPATK